MKKLLSIALITVGFSTLINADTFYLQPGWNLVGSSDSIDVAEYFNNDDIKIVWRYENGEWQYYTPNPDVASMINGQYPTFSFTNPNEGFWVYSLSNLIIDTNIDNNLSELAKSLLDTPINFNIDDIKSKTFALVDYKGNFSYLQFDSNGNGNIVIHNKTYNAKLNNGKVNLYFDDSFVGNFEKVVSDENGTIVVGNFVDSYNDFNYAFRMKNILDAWVTNPTLVDMSTINYPITFYDWFGDEFNITADGLIQTSDGEFNYTIINGEIVYYDRGEGWDDEFHMQIVSKIGRYYVLKNKDFMRDWQIEDSLKDKNISALIGKNIFEYYFREDGTIEDSENGDNFDSITYEEVNETALKIIKCNEYNCFDNEIVTLDPNTGKVVREREDNYYFIVSKTPILKSN